MSDGLGDTHDDAGWDDAYVDDGASPRGRMVLAICSVMGVLMVALIAFLATREPQTDLIPREVVGQIAPTVTGPTVGGSEFVLEDHRGQWVLVNMFALWCPGCLVEHEELKDFSARHRDDGAAQVVTVMLGGEDANEVAAWFAAEGGDWPLIVDETTIATFMTEYGVTGVPETYIISPSGRVVEKLVSNAGITADALDQALGLSETES